MITCSKRALGTQKLQYILEPQVNDILGHGIRQEQADIPLLFLSFTTPCPDQNSQK